jgi:hypothetical protein
MAATGHQSAQNLLNTALARATSSSLIQAAFAEGRTVTLKMTDGRRIRLKKLGESQAAEIVTDDGVVDARPSGKFDLPNGEGIVLEDGHVVEWTDSFATINRWAIFALLPGQ